jgi:peroxiredoxin
MSMTLLSRCVPLVLFGFFTLLFAEAEVGEKAPDFTLPSTIGDQVSLKDYLGKKHVVLEFYVLDFTPG